MKKLNLILVLLTVFSASETFGQKQKGYSKSPHVTLCQATTDNDTLTYDDLLKCNELSTTDKELKIKSFTLSVNVNGSFIDIENQGAKLSGQAITIFKPSQEKQVKKLIIENVKVIDANSKTERTIKGIVINIKG
jgi:hypothetical protein